MLDSTAWNAPQSFVNRELGPGPANATEALTECKIELIFIPVTDVDAAIDF